MKDSLDKMKLTKFPQSCFLIETEGKKILIDPGNEVDEETISNFKDIDLILITHIHNDHCFVDYVKKILENNKPEILGNQEVAEKLSEFNVTVVDEGDIKELGNIKIEVVKGIHGYHPWMKENPVPKVNGYIIRNSKTSVYHPGDTLSFYNEFNVDVLLAPICGNGVVMNPEVAVEWGIMMNVKLLIPIHYESDKHPQGTEKFKAYAKDKELNYKILKNGESTEL
jgi:L-ascorbate metabolism protein UlaG (beta-lactamase superfamily)